MSVVYRLLGIVAKLNERLSRQSINLIPLNLALFAGLSVLLGIGAKSARDGMVNDEHPEIRNLADVLDHKKLDKNYMAVSGLLITEAGFQYVTKSKSGKEQVKADYIPLIDPVSGRALLVKAKPRPIDEEAEEPTQKTIIGMLTSLDSGVRAELEKTGGMIETISVDQDVMLEEGATPGDAVVWSLLTGLAALGVILLVLTWALRYTVFRKGSGSLLNGGVRHPAGVVPAARDNSSDEQLCVSGCFALDGTKRRFHNVPAVLRTDDDGNAAFLVNVDASSRFFGVVTKERTGIWNLTFRKDALAGAVPGEYYFGLQKKPALKISYSDAGKSKTRSAVVSFGSEAERTAMAARLNEIVGYALVK